MLIISDGRGGQIRTDDFLLPKQALYQAELRPATGRTLGESLTGIKKLLSPVKNPFQSIDWRVRILEGLIATLM